MANIMDKNLNAYKIIYMGDEPITYNGEPVQKGVPIIIPADKNANVLIRCIRRG